MKYAMLSNLIPKEMESEFRENSRHNMQDAASTLQWNLYEGFCENLKCDIPLFNVIPVGSYPQYYNKAFIKKQMFNGNGINIGFCNIKLLRNYFKVGKIYKVLKKWCQEEKEPKTLFVYTLSQPLIKAVVKIKKEYPDLKVCAIVADLPNMASLSSKKRLAQKLYNKWTSQSSYNMLSCVNAFVLLTKHMATYMQIQQPFVVMEGVADEAQVNEKFDYSEQKEKIILYTGTLHKKFGILHLLNAFSQIQREDFRLVLCGVGDGEDEIRKAMKKDCRIEFMGQLKREEVLKLQKKATVLVNPRLNHENFTKYSFPSKTMEYLASGVPVVAYKLDGIPEEYDRHIQYPKDDTVLELAEKIKEICMMNESQRNEIGRLAQQFVLQEKNKYAQTQKIINLVRHMEEIK